MIDIKELSKISRNLAENGINAIPYGRMEEFGRAILAVIALLEEATKAELNLRIEMAKIKKGG